MTTETIRVAGPVLDGCGERYTMHYRGERRTFRLYPQAVPPRWAVHIEGIGQPFATPFPFTCIESAYDAALAHVQEGIDEQQR